MSGERSTSPDLAAEMAVVSAGFLVKDFWEAALRLPQPDDFDDPDLAAIWEATLEAREKGAVTRLSVGRHLRELQWDDKKAFSVIKQAEARFCTLPEALAAIEILLSRRARRRALSVLDATRKELATTVNVAEVVHRCEVALADLAGAEDGGNGTVSGEGISEERLERVETGIEDFDRVSGGLPSGALTLVPARTGMGKTAFVTALLRNVASRGEGGLLDELEMQNLQVLHRMASAEAYRVCRPAESRRVNPWYSDYDARLLQGELKERFETAKAICKKYPIWWNDKQGRSISQIRLGARRTRLTAQRTGVELRLVVVDHIGKIYPDKAGKDRHLELGEISNGLMEMAAELKLPVVALAQLNRSVESRPDKRPLISDIRESGRLEEDAHTIVTLYRQAYYDDQARQRGEEFDEKRQAEATAKRYILEANFVKNRGGPLKRVDLFCDIGANAIMDQKVGFSAVPGRATDTEDLFA